MQFSLKGQTEQFGDFGTHCKAPNSIIAWLWIAGFSIFINFWDNSLNIFFPADESIGVSIAKYLLKTLLTFPSKTA